MASQTFKSYQPYGNSSVSSFGFFVPDGTVSPQPTSTLPPVTTIPVTSPPRAVTPRASFPQELEQQAADRQVLQMAAAVPVRSIANSAPSIASNVMLAAPIAGQVNSLSANKTTATLSASGFNFLFGNSAQQDVLSRSVKMLDTRMRSVPDISPRFVNSQMGNMPFWGAGDVSTVYWLYCN
eukprot:Platyproteum_vivax@DN1299_c0_g1_i1.p2